MMTTFNVLLGKTLADVSVNSENTEIKFTADDGQVFRLFHEQDCCEGVSIESIVGDLKDLIGAPILHAEEAVSRDHPEGYKAHGCDYSFTWTFYKLATVKGWVDIRWLGESNGYYSESVYFEALPAEERDRLGFAKWKEEQQVTTHSPGCWQLGPQHHACALREIERLRHAEFNAIVASIDDATARGVELEARMALPDAEPAWWMIEYTGNGRIRNSFFRTNAIGEYLAIYPDATSTPLYTGPQPAIAPEPVKFTNDELAGLRKINDLESIPIEAFRCAARAIEDAIYAKQGGKP